MEILTKEDDTKEALYTIKILEEYNEIKNNSLTIDNIFNDNTWKKDYNKEKKDYIHKVFKFYGYLPRSIGFWRLSKIKKRFPL